MDEQMVLTVLVHERRIETLTDNVEREYTTLELELLGICQDLFEYIDAIDEEHT